MIDLSQFFNDEEMHDLEILKENSPIVRKLVDIVVDNGDSVSVFKMKLSQLTMVLSADIDKIIADNVEDLPTIINDKNKHFDKLMVLIDKSPKLIQSISAFGSAGAGSPPEKPGKKVPITRSVTP